MKRNGFSLVELLSVIAIMSIVLSMAGLYYNSWMKKYRLEGQVRELRIDLINARAQAMQKNRIYFVKVDGNSYSLIEDKNDNGTADDAALWTKQLKYSSAWVDTAVLDTRGLVSPNDTIRFNSGGVSAEYDCITLSATRIRLGKLNDSNECVAR